MTDSARRGILVVLLSTFLALSTVSIRSQSATFDEVNYFGIGKYLLLQHRWDIMGSILHPPLSYYLNSVPLLFVHEDRRIWEYPGRTRDLDFLGDEDMLRGQVLLSSADNANDRLLIASRLLFTLCGVLLGYYVYRFSCELYGTAGGFLSLVLYVFSPTILAYAGLIVPDLPLTAFFFMTVYYLWRCRRDDRLRNRVSAGISLGLALLAKFTAVLLLPLLAAYALLVARRDKRNPVPALAVALAVAALLFLSAYFFDITPYLQGIRYQLAHAARGHAAFLMGQYSTHGWWYYDIVAFLIKTPVPVIVLFVAALYLWMAKPVTDRTDTLFLVLPILVVAGFFSIEHQSIGIRYILPVYPFIFVLAGSLAACGKRVRYGAGVAALWQVVALIGCAPHYLAYFNEFVGGPGNGYEYLVDSNLDWGQDLKGLQRYMAEHHIPRISLSYFGMDSPARYGIAYDWMPSYYLYNPDPDRVARLHPGQPFAISATNLQGLYLDDRDTYKWLLQYQPVAKIGYSIFVYDLGKGTIDGR